ncbi:MAG: hypothetical protein RIS76_995 [Verrucomicrobiota bacterium]|jgi:hypothetical protein
MKPHLPITLLLVTAAGAPVCAIEPPAVEVSMESQFSSDITLTQSTASWFDQAGPWNWNVSISGATTGIDYQPVTENLFGYATQLSESRVAGQASARHTLTPKLTALAGVSAYSGFANFQSVWINEFYQQWFAGLPGLEDPGPSGANGTLGLRWEYRTGTGFIESSVTRAHDVIAPGYDEVIDPDQGLVGVTPLRDQLNTVGWSVKFENILTRRLRSQFEFRLAGQSESGLRLSGLAALNWAIAKNWVARLDTGYITESPYEPQQTPRFRSGWAAVTLDRHLGEHWWVSISGRGYSDNGVVQDSISFSTSAPAITAWQATLGIRGVWGRHSVKLSGGPYFTDYAPVDFSTLFFANLYRDRTYGVVQAGYRYEF